MDKSADKRCAVQTPRKFLVTNSHRRFSKGLNLETATEGNWQESSGWRLHLMKQRYGHTWSHGTVHELRCGSKSVAVKHRANCFTASTERISWRKPTTLLCCYFNSNICSFKNKIRIHHEHWPRLIFILCLHILISLPTFPSKRKTKCFSSPPKLTWHTRGNIPQVLQMYLTYPSGEKPIESV